MKKVLVKLVCLCFLLAVSITINAQIRYYSNGNLTIGNTTPKLSVTLFGSGAYFKYKTSNFFQLDCTPDASRLASHNDQVVFYNTDTGRYNNIQVENVYNYSDARAKTNIFSLNSGLNIVSRLRAVKYDFKDKDAKAASVFKVGGDGKEIGLLAQEVEQVLPNVVMTDPDGKKLVNYTALIPVLIQAVQELQTEIATLKAQK